MKNQVLIISYVFPPSVEVGGRRWNKFAKAIHQLGGEVTVISSDMGLPLEQKQDKQKHICKRYYIKNQYPEVLNNSPISILDRIKYRLALKKVKKVTVGNYYDRGIFAEDDLLDQLKNVLSQSSFGKVIVTGAPFSILYYLSKWKKEFGYQLVCDIRDPWTVGDSYGINRIEKSRFLEETRREQIVFENSDLVTVPNDAMCSIYSNKYADYTSKIKVLPHGFDESEFINCARKPVEGFKNWLYGGTLYSECKDLYSKLFECVEAKEDVNMSVYGRNNSIIETSYSNVDFFEIISPVEFNKIAISKDCFIWIFPRKFKDYLSTKLFELIRCRIPIVYIGFEGDFSRFISKNRIGVFISEVAFLEEPDQIINKLKALDYNTDFPIENYSTARIIETIL